MVRAAISETISCLDNWKDGFSDMLARTSMARCKRWSSQWYMMTYPVHSSHLSFLSRSQLPSLPPSRCPRVHSQPCLRRSIPYGTVDAPWSVHTLPSREAGAEPTTKWHGTEKLRGSDEETSRQTYYHMLPRVHSLRCQAHQTRIGMQLCRNKQRVSAVKRMARTFSEHIQSCARKPLIDSDYGSFGTFVENLLFP